MKSYPMRAAMSCVLLQWLVMSGAVRADDGSFTVTNTRNGFSKTYGARR